MQQISFKVDAPKGVLPNGEHLVKASNGKNTLNLPLSEDVMPTWREMEKVGQRDAFDVVWPA